MIDDLIENIDSCLRLNAIGDMSDRLTINYIQMWTKNYKKEKSMNVPNEIDAHNARVNYYGGTNPND